MTVVNRKQHVEMPWITVALVTTALVLAALVVRSAALAILKPADESDNNHAVAITELHVRNAAEEQREDAAGAAAQLEASWAYEKKSRVEHLRERQREQSAQLMHDAAVNESLPEEERSALALSQEEAKALAESGDLIY